MKLISSPLLVAILVLAAGLASGQPSQYPYVRATSPAAVFPLPYTCQTTIVNGASSSDAVGANCAGLLSPTQQTYTELTFILPDAWSGDTIYLYLVWGNPSGGSSTGNIQFNVSSACVSLSSFYATPTYPTPNQLTAQVPALGAARGDYIAIPMTGCILQGPNILRVKIWNTIGGPSTFPTYVSLSGFALGIRQ